MAIGYPSFGLYSRQFDATSDTDKNRQLKEFENKRLLNLLITSDDPVIESTRNEALVAVKLVGWEYYKDDYKKKDEHLTNEIARYQQMQADVAANRKLDIIYEGKCDMLDKMNEYIAEYYEVSYNTIDEVIDDKDTKDIAHYTKSIMNWLRARRSKI